MATFFGSNSADVLIGSNFDDLVVPGGGNDNVSGAGGNDLFYLDFGDDTVQGGLGDDVFTYFLPVRGGQLIAGHDLITDFSIGDTLSLAPIYDALGISSQFWGMLLVDNGLGGTTLFLDTNDDGLSDYTEFSITFLGLTTTTFEGVTLNGGDFAIPSPSSGIPEPSTWIMLILGFAMCHLAMRARKKPQLKPHPVL